MKRFCHRWFIGLAAFGLLAHGHALAQSSITGIPKPAESFDFPEPYPAESSSGLPVWPRSFAGSDKRMVTGLELAGLESRRDLPGIDELRAAGLLEPLDDAFAALGGEGDGEADEADEAGDTA